MVDIYHESLRSTAALLVRSITRARYPRAALTRPSIGVRIRSPSQQLVPVTAPSPLAHSPSLSSVSVPYACGSAQFSAAPSPASGHTPEGRFPQNTISPRLPDELNENSPFLLPKREFSQSGFSGPAKNLQVELQGEAKDRPEDRKAL